LIADVIARRPELGGLYQVAAGRINKHDLVTLLNDAFGTGIAIEPVDGPVVDRSLDGSRLRRTTGFEAPSWPAMVGELAADEAPYDTWRRALGRETP
jgi:dTDP-4-dehydrorhamnose reductase